MTMRNGASTGVLLLQWRLPSTILILLSLVTVWTDAAFLTDFSKKSARWSRSWSSISISTPRLGSSRASSTWNQEDIRQEKRREALMEAMVVGTSAASSLLPIHLVGQSELVVAGNKDNSTASCLVLSTKSASSSSSCLMMPLPTSDSDRRLKLVQFAYQRKRLSKSVLLGLNMLLVNRDGSLFDNLPWAEWSVDPMLRNRDAANNPISAKFHLGKRDAYHQMMGKDWKGRSANLGNLAARLKYQLEREQESDFEPEEEEEPSKVLARRLLELEIRELQMEMAECESLLAIARTNELDELQELEQRQQDCLDRLQASEDSLDKLANAGGGESPPGEVQTVLRQVVDHLAGGDEAPYRGAIGYRPILDSKEDFETSSLPFTSPFDVLRNIIEHQLHARVIGAVLENTSLLEGTLALGGALILQRRTPTKTISIDGEQLMVQDEDDDLGNLGLKGGECILVECDGDEAIAMALASNASLSVESTIWERASLPSRVVDQLDESDSVMDALPVWTPLDSGVALLAEGQARNVTDGSQSALLRIPRTTASLFDSLSQQRSSTSEPSSLFPDDNPIQSIAAYDALSNDEKARTLISMSNFDGALPRPRALRQWDPSVSSLSPLDELLLPRIDESVRRQYLIRDAELRQDDQALEQLRSSMSPRQRAKEKAAEAREAGLDDEAEVWENEAELYGNLRADVTQDEGDYSRFLDKDEWYEREQRALRERNKKFKFGTLLDGIE